MSKPAPSSRVWVITINDVPEPEEIDPIDPAIEAAWLEEAKCRLESVRAGQLKTVLAHEVERRLWAMLERGRVSERGS